MTEPLQVGQFAIVDHEPVDRGPNAGVFHGKGPADDRAELFILAEGTTPAGEAFAGHVVSALGHAFATLDMSLTGSLQRLFEEAERNIVDWNRKSIAQHRVSIGLTCFGRRGNQAVIAQAGPSAVYHLHAGQVQEYFTDEAHGRPIGLGQVAPQLTRIDFAPGDRLLMISTVALHEIDDEVISGILRLPGHQVLPDLYHRLSHVRHLTTLLMTSPHAGMAAAAADEEFVIDATGGVQAPPVAQPFEQATAIDSSNFQPSLFIADEREAAVDAAKRQLLEITPRRQMDRAVPAVITEMPAPLLRVAGESLLAQMAAERQARATLARASLAASMGAARTLGGEPTNAGALDTHLGGNSNGNGNGRKRYDRRDSFSRGLVHEEVPPKPDAAVVDVVPLVQDLAAEHRAHVTTTAAAAETIAGEAAATLSGGGSLVRVRDHMSGRWKGSGTFSRRTTVNGQLPPTWLVILVGLGILLTLVGIITVPRMLSQQSSERYATLVDGAQQRLATARVQQDPAQRRTALTEAQAMLLEAQDLNINGAEAGDLLKQVKSEIATMDAVKAPQAVDVIGSLEQFGDKPVSVTRMSIGEENAYILDGASNQVIAMPLAGGAPKVIYGEDKDAKHGRPVAQAFIESAEAGASTLLIADSNNALWSYSGANGLQPVAFTQPANVKVTDIAVNGRDLYVLDAAQSAVYKFAASDTGAYNATAVKVLETPDLAAARRMMVDSDIVTTDANGTVHRFAGTLSLTLSQAGIDKKLVAAATAQTTAKNGDLFLLDAPNDRIVVFRRDGAFDHQYTHKDFRASSALAIRNGVAYIFSEGKLRKVTF